MGYTKEELAEKQALKDLSDTIVGDTEMYTVKQLDELFKAMKYNEEGCVEIEQYHLAEAWNELSKEISAEFAL